MSDLQIALLIIGLLVLAAIYGYGQWQQREYERRTGGKSAVRTATRKSMDEVFKPFSERLAQSKLANQFESLLDHPLVRKNNEPPEVAPLPPEPLTPEPMPEVSEPVLVADTCVLFNEPGDLVATLRPAQPITAAALTGLWPHKFDFGKPLQVCGLTLDLPHWERVIADSPVQYSQVRIALQLVDRSGVMSVPRVTSFVDLVRGVAQSIPVEAALPDMALAYQNAQDLDKFCADVDKMVGINLLPNDGEVLYGAQIAHAVAELDLSLEADGAFHRLSTQGQSLFSLINQQNELFQHHNLQNIKTSGVTLLLDVPRASNPLGQFDEMVNTALQLADALDLNLVDDYLVALDDAGLTAIRTAISAMEARMIERGITPGSVHARRLFA